MSYTRRVTLTAPPRLLLVHAHPDDESLTTGGTIARYATHGVQVTVVTCTLGEQGEIIPPSLAGLAADAADQLGGYRIGELRSACAALGVTDHRFLGGAGRWRDSGMAGEPANEHPRALVRGDLAEQAGELAKIISEVKPQVVICYDANGGYGHPDHIRAHQITMAAVEQDPDVQRLFYTVNSREAIKHGVALLSEMDGLPFRLPAPDEFPSVEDHVITSALDVSEHIAAKAGALRSHATQVSVWQDPAGATCYALSDGVARPLLDTEHFVLARGPADAADRDLFGGLDLVGGGHVDEEARL